MKTLVLLSGGLDSAVVLADCVASGHQCRAVGFDYGQPHRIELLRAQMIADHYHVDLEIYALPHMPKINDVVFAGRNLVFASVAISVAQARGFQWIAVGCNASDWQQFPDCRPSFWRALENCAAAYDVGVLAPLLHNPKSDIFETARKLNVPIDLTWSCYSPRDDEPCGQCLACKTRKEAECSLSFSIS